MFLMHASWPLETENKGKSQEVNSRFGSHLNDSMKLVKRELVQLKFTALCWHIPFTQTMSPGQSSSERQRTELLSKGSLNPALVKDFQTLKLFWARKDGS